MFTQLSSRFVLVTWAMSIVAGALLEHLLHKPRP